MDEEIGELLTPTYLKLMADIRKKNFIIQGAGGKPWSQAYWNYFTIEFNNRVRNAFQNNAPEDHRAGDVVVYGKKLEEAFNIYKQSEDKGASVPGYTDYVHAFGDCSRCSYLPKFPVMGKRKKGASSSEELESGDYLWMILRLIYQCVEGEVELDGLMWSWAYWRNFTNRFNERVAQLYQDGYLDEPLKFTVDEVVFYAFSLKRKYDLEVQQVSNESLIDHFERYVTAFGKCDYCCLKPSYNAFNCARTRISKTKTARAGKELAKLVNESAISMNAMDTAAEKFQDFPDEATTWLVFNREHRIRYVKRHFGA